jgi:hypothetical protein
MLALVGLCHRRRTGKVYEVLIMKHVFLAFLVISLLFGSGGIQNGVVTGGASGSTITRGPIASLPGSVPAAGNMYICSDSPYYFVSDGSAWQPYVAGYNVVQPVLANFTQVKVDLTTLDTTHGGIIMAVSGNGGSEDNQVLAQAIPGSGAYYVDAACICQAVQNNGGFGSLFLDGLTSANKEVMGVFGWQGSFGSWGWKSYNSATSHNSDSGQEQIVTGSPLLWFRMYDDRTTNRTFYFSTNGFDWQQTLQESRTNFLTPADVGLVVVPFNSPQIVHWVHFSVHT